MRDILVNNEEYVNACRTIYKFNNDMMSLLERYNRVLNSMQSSALKDELINAKLKNISSKVMGQASAAQGALQELNSAIVKTTSKIEAADNFTFPF